MALFKKHYPQAADYCISDEAMKPKYNLGDYVGGIICIQDRVDTVIGQDCIVKLSNGQLIVRKVFKGQEPNHYTLVPLNLESKRSLDGAVGAIKVYYYLSKPVYLQMGCNAGFTKHLFQSFLMKVFGSIR